MTDPAPRVALLTQHGKEQVITPVLGPALGWRIERIDGYDTDRLGSFTREIPRPGSQLDAARRKARIGMEMSGLTMGLASEGSFGPDPHTGMFPWNVELVLLIDDRRRIEVAGIAEGPALNGQLHTGDWDELEAFARRLGFPAHALVLRPGHADAAPRHKGVTGWDELRAAFDDTRAAAADGRVWVENDLRAMHHPSRLQRIGEATADLLARLQSACPACGLPGFAVVEREAGLCCVECGLPTRVHRAEVWQCVACRHRVVRPRTDRPYADPKDCGFCNP